MFSKIKNFLVSVCPSINEPPPPGLYSDPETRPVRPLTGSSPQSMEHGQLTHYRAFAHSASLIHDASSQTAQIRPTLQFLSPPRSLPRSFTP